MPYVIMWITSTFFAYLASKAKRRDVAIFFSVIAILIPSTMGGLRTVKVGFDTSLYAFPHFTAAYNASSFSAFLAVDKRLYLEWGWAAVTYCSAKIFGHFNCNLFIYQLITVACTYIAIYKHRKIVYAPLVWLAFCWITYIMTLNYIRQSIAASIVFLGLTDLESKHYGKFLVYIVIGMLFHSSAFIAIHFIIFHFLLTWETTHTSIKRILLYGGLLSMIFAKLIMRTLTSSIPFLHTYAGYENIVTSNMLIGSAISGLLVGELILVLLYPAGFKRTFSYGNMYDFYKYSLIFNLTYRFFVRIFVSRVLYYFDFINVILIASLPLFIKERTLRNLVAISVVITLLIYYYLVVIMRNSAVSWPYQSILM